MDASQIKIETERLALVPPSQKYADQIFIEYRDPVTRYMNYPPPPNVDFLRERMSEREERLKRGELIFMVALLKETNEFLGCFSLENLGQRDPELGGWLKASAHGHGYGREAAGALKKWADENLDYSHLIWPCAAENTPSCALAESLEGRVQKTYEKKNASGKVWPFVEYWIPRRKLWFKAKRYGWGWSPSTWQGWLSTLAYVVLTAAPAVAFEGWVDAHLGAFLAYLSLLSGLFIFLCYKKGEKPEWRWGEKN